LVCICADDLPSAGASLSPKSSLNSEATVLHTKV
jgi:hypothetical protein